MVEKISIDKNICHGKPHVRGTRIMVQQVLDLLATGISADEIIREDFPDLTKEDIQACILFTNQLVRNEKIIFYESSQVEVM